MSEETPNAAAAERGRRVALLLEYDGTRFAGSQLQSNAVTVQGVLEDAVSKTTKQAPRVAFAGRTDAGVHARGQVAAFSTSSRLDCETLRRALNAWLPEDVVVREAIDVEAGFDPRRDARRRHYRYVIDNDNVRSALRRRVAWHVPGELDLEAMAAAARRLVGRHNFAAFASRMEDPAASTVRDMYSFDVTRGGTSVFVDATANAFLPHQVRRMTGALVGVGKGRLHAEGFAALLDSAAGSAGPAAPPQGLYLMRVTYDKRIFEAENEC
jgi:tRNA pseudouridine38-40 synthase